MTLTQINGLILLSHSTSAEWEASNIPIPNGVYCYETDTHRSKIGDGNQLYANLPYHVEKVLSDEQALLLENPNIAESIVQLDASGDIPLANIDPIVQNDIKTVPTITERNNLSTLDRTQSLIFVADASSDPNITSGSAVYAYNADTSTWILLTQSNPLTIDISNYITKNDGFDILSDTSSYIRMRPDEKAKIASLMVETEVYHWQNLGPSAFISDFTGGDETDEANLMHVVDKGLSADPKIWLVSTPR